MKAMIFAAGLGTRLRPITDSIPKALVPLNGVPMLQRTILRLKEEGFDEFVINIHHFGQKIIDFLKLNNNFGVNIYISDERSRLLDTGGGILKAKELLYGDEPFLVHNVDIVSDIPLRNIYERHCSSEADATLIVSRRKTSRYLVFDNNRNLQGWINKSTGEIRPAGFTYRNGYEEYAFGGIHILSPKILDLMGKNEWEGNFPIIPFYLDICQKAQIHAEVTDNAHWFDIGKHETLSKAEAWLKSIE